MTEKVRKTKKLYDLMAKAEQWTPVIAIRGGLLSITPVLIIGAFALILKTFPLAFYQNFITSFANGLLLSFFDFVYSATFGVLSIYMAASISRSYKNIKSNTSAPLISVIISSLLSFFILAGAYLPTFSADSVGPKSMFLAIITGIGASAVYIRLYDALNKRQRRFYSAGADMEFNRMLSCIAPLALTAIIFAVFNTIIVYAFKVDSFRMLLVLAFDKLFSVGKVGFFKGFFFVLLSSVLWFFGIHGSDTLESVMQNVFAPGLEINRAAIAVGNAPTEVLNKVFFDCFVLMGGCGSAICLLIAILLFSRNRARRGLGLAAAFPMVFNINELMVFGLPVIFNPVMLIPFVAVPLVCYTVSYFALFTGLVPMITQGVEWTTPIILGGLHATGSVAGSLLQIFNVIVGTLIYAPFIRLLDRRDEEKYRREYDSFVSFFRKNEKAMSGMRLTEQDNVYGEFAKSLCAELEHGLKRGVVLAYQPQYDYEGSCVGVEVLLRWNHPVYGMLYPPIVIKLAEEGGFLPDLEEAVFTHALQERPKVLEKFGKDVKISINVTGKTIVSPRYLQFCRKLDEKDPFSCKNICLEVTEQDSLSFDESTVNAFKALKALGLSLAIDDFSMGQTSVNYLKENLFDFIKLDGSLVRELFDRSNCREIIISISRLAKSLRLSVIAEYVETKEQLDALHETGCDFYQGYLFSPAVFISEIKK
ncbi:MAG: PTS sugar transporter subunit IIC/EAL domain-containing protein [Clostridia bacterium]|nr:PTS sugar transporter subunit IIC/EAL domain-containing protein [Clostridia bacterium]